MDIFLNENRKCKDALTYKELINSKFFLGLFNYYKKQNDKEEEEKIFDICLKSFCELELLNNFNENNNIYSIPNFEIISEEIEKIIKENKYNKNECINIIRRELDLVEKICKHLDYKITLPKENEFQISNSFEIRNINKLINQEDNEIEDKLKLKKKESLDFEKNSKKPLKNSYEIVHKRNVDKSLKNDISEKND